MPFLTTSLDNLVKLCRVCNRICSHPYGASVVLIISSRKKKKVQVFRSLRQCKPKIRKCKYHAKFTSGETRDIIKIY